MTQFAHKMYVDKLPALLQEFKDAGRDVVRSYKNMSAMAERTVPFLKDVSSQPEPTQFLAWTDLVYTPETNPYRIGLAENIRKVEAMIKPS